MVLLLRKGWRAMGREGGVGRMEGGEGEKEGVRGGEGRAERGGSLDERGGKGRGEKRRREEVYNSRKRAPVVRWLVTGLRRGGL